MTRTALAQIIAPDAFAADLPQTVAKVWQDRALAKAEALMAQLSLPVWRDMATAPKEPIEHNIINSFTSRLLGPTLLLLIPFDELTTSVGWWSPKDNCWRHLEDDGADDIQPIRWMPLPGAHLP